MGIEPFLVASAVNFIMAQRLVRKICSKCHGKDPNCLTCGGSGYKGRVGIFEMMTVTENIRELVHKRASIAELKSCAISEGMKTLAMDGAEKAAAGLTSESEIAAEATI